jgi:AbrB family looped-hinge helix DNA binding protein
MLATIDGGGRVVVPKEVRDRMGLRPGSRVELLEVGGHLEIAPVTTPVALTVDEGVFVARPSVAIPLMSAAEVRATMEASRR